MTGIEAEGIVNEIVSKINEKFKQKGGDWSSYSFVGGGIKRRGMSDWPGKSFALRRSDDVYCWIGCGLIFDFQYDGGNPTLDVLLFVGDTAASSPAERPEGGDLRHGLETAPKDEKDSVIAWANDYLQSAREDPNAIFPDSFKYVDELVFNSVFSRSLTIVLHNKSNINITLSVGPNEEQLVADDEIRLFRNPLSIPLGADTDLLADTVVTSIVKFWNNMFEMMDTIVFDVWDYIQDWIAEYSERQEEDGGEEDE